MAMIKKRGVMKRLLNFFRKKKPDCEAPVAEEGILLDGRPMSVSEHKEIYNLICRDSYKNVPRRTFE
jgi:hypothetical protein